MSYRTGAYSKSAALTLCTPDQRSNRPPLQEQVDQLNVQVKTMREAMSSLMAAMLPAFQALEHLEEAARCMHQFDKEDGNT